jgi:hypothetical protein
MGAGVRIEEELVRIEAQPVIGLIRAVHAKAVDRAGADLGHVPVPDLVAVFGKLDALLLGLAGLVEQAQLDLRRLRREQREIDPLAVPGRTAGERQAFLDGCHPPHARRALLRACFG